MQNSFAGFRAFFEKYEPVSKKDKEGSRDRAAGDNTMDVFGGEEYNFVRGKRGEKGAMYRKIKRTSPEIMSGADYDGVSANYVAASMTPGLRGGSVKAIDVGAQAQASKNGRDLDPDEINTLLKGKRYVKRKDMAGFANRPWASVLAAGAAGGAAGGMPGGMPGGM